MTITTDLVIAFCTGFMAVAAVVGVVVRWVLLPYLREKLIEPLEHVSHQVTENHHSSERPTVPDRIDSLSQQVAQYHDWAKVENRRVWTEMSAIHHLIERLHPDDLID